MNKKITLKLNFKKVYTVYCINLKEFSYRCFTCILKFTLHCIVKMCRNSIQLMDKMIHC